MKKFFKYLIFILMAFVMLPLSIDSKYLLKSNAVGDNYHTVNFYDYTNNNIFYSIDNIPNGYNLDDLENANLLSNSYFGGTIYNSSTNNPYLDNWRRFNGSIHLSRNNDLSLQFENLQSGVISSLGQSFSTFSPGHYYCGFYVSCGDYPRAIRIRFYDETNNAFYLDQDWSVTQPGYYFAEFDFPNVVTNSCRLMFVTYTVSVFNLYYSYLGTENLPYFNEEYLNFLYMLNGQSEISSFNQPPQQYFLNKEQTQLFNFDMQITSNLNIYSDYVQCNFYNIDRIEIFLTLYCQIGRELNFYNSYVYNKFIEFNNLNVNDISNFYYFKGFYNYEEYLSNYYIILNKEDFYCEIINANPNYTGDYTYVHEVHSVSSDIDNNLLNQINLDSINLYFENFVLTTNTYMSQFTNSTLISDFVLGYNRNIYIDNYNNEFEFVTFVEYNDGTYYFNNYLVGCKILDSDFVYIPVCNYNKFIYEENDVFKFYNMSDHRNNVNIKSYINIDYGQLYYYSDIAEYGLNFDNPSSISFNNFTFILNNDINLNTTIATSSHYTALGFQSNYLMSYYPKQLYIDFDYNSYVDFDFETSTSKEMLIQLIEHDYSFKIYFKDNIKVAFILSDSDTSTGLIPTTSTGLYREKKNWYDFGTDLYNFVIYLLFDAPIVSNFTKLIYIIIALIIKVVEIIIGFFTGLTNNIFLTAILGFLILRFIISLFFKGGE